MAIFNGHFVIQENRGHLMNIFSVPGTVPDDFPDITHLIFKTNWELDVHFIGKVSEVWAG